jgi:ABC-type transport system involved in multi-copper enzyme maturation permease subunit
MSALYAAELMKLRTLRSTWGFVLVTMLFAGLVTAGNIGGSSPSERLDSQLQSQIALDVAFPASVLALLLGIILVTNEFRHGTIARTLLAAPRRGRFVVVKLLAATTVGAWLALAALAVSSVTAAIWLGALDVPLEPGEWGDGAWRALLAALVAGAFGSAIGGAVHSQVGALVGTLVWMFVLEPICWVLLALLDVDGVASYLPAAALGGMVDSESGSTSWLRSVAVAFGWTAVAAGLAFVRTSRRDIT